jgi:LacI family transcriptional regulator, fructose operon transcriptional repressor
MSKRETVQIRDVAKRAAVSSATVSRVLANKPHVREELKARVLQAASELHYEPNRIARSLRIQRSSVIGLIISDIRNSFFNQVVRAIEDTAYKNGYAVFVCNSDESPEKEAWYVNILRAEHVAGVIMTPTRETTTACQTLLSAGIPVVAVDRSVLGVTMDSILTDNIDAAFKLVTHLIKGGHTRIGAIFSELGITTGRERFEGYKRALREAGIALDETLVRTGLPIDEDGYRLAASLLKLSDPPTALFSGSKLLTQGTLHAISDLGLSVPKDLALASFDKLDWMPALPRMSYAEQPAYELGKSAIELLFKRFENPQGSKKKVILPSSLTFDSPSRQHAYSEDFAVSPSM